MSLATTLLVVYSLIVNLGFTISKRVVTSAHTLHAIRSNQTRFSEENFDAFKQVDTMVAPKELYDLLGVNKDATQAKIKRAYYMKARDLHPDKHPNDPDASEKFTNVSNAYEILSDPDLRAKYDEGLENTSYDRGYENMSYDRGHGNMSYDRAYENMPYARGGESMSHDRGYENRIVPYDRGYGNRSYDRAYENMQYARGGENMWHDRNYGNMSYARQYPNMSYERQYPNMSYDRGGENMSQEHVLAIQGDAKATAECWQVPRRDGSVSFTDSKDMCAIVTDPNTINELKAYVVTEAGQSVDTTAVESTSIFAPLWQRKFPNKEPTAAEFASQYYKQKYKIECAASVFAKLCGTSSRLASFLRMPRW